MKKSSLSRAAVLMFLAGCGSLLLSCSSKKETVQDSKAAKSVSPTISCPTKNQECVPFGDMAAKVSSCKKKGGMPFQGIACTDGQCFRCIGEKEGATKE